MRPFQLREVQADPELDAIYQLRVAAWRSANTWLPTDCDGRYLENEDTDSTHVGAFIDTTLVGAARLRIHRRADGLPLLPRASVYAGRCDGPVGYMSRLVVHPAFRRRGIARELVAWMMRRAQTSQAAWAVALTNVTPMRDLLVARGFGCVEPVPFSWGRLTVNGSFLWRRLTPGSCS